MCIYNPLHMTDKKVVDISDIKENPNNPRFIRDEKFKSLVKSVKEFPEMLELRPIVVNRDWVILWGNMRYKACKEAGIKKVPIIVADNLSPEQEKEFLIKDNTSWGEWDYDILANEWGDLNLAEWGVDMPISFDAVGDEPQDEKENPYTKKIEAPIYTPSEEAPEMASVVQLTKYEQLIKEINKSSVSDIEKEFLKLAATRHIVFNYKYTADMYAHSGKEMQALMEKSALVIIDFNKAIEYWYVNMSKEILDNYLEEYADEIDEE
mgnify:CR=1 FL=1